MTEGFKVKSTLKMKINFLIFSPLLFIVSCTSNTQTNNNKFDTSKQESSKSISLTNDQNDNTLDKKVLGIWTDGTTDNATFDIRQDSIYYVDQFATYKYSIDKDTIKIDYSDWTYEAKIEIKNDTLIFTNEDGGTKFWRFKK